MVTHPTAPSSPYATLPTELTGAIAAALKAGPVLLASDFDGVLAPLVNDPAASRMTTQSAAALTKVAYHDNRNLALALVSGRPLAQLFDLARPPHRTYLIGSHGAESGQVQHGQLRRAPHTLSPAQAAALTAVTALAHELALTTPGAWVEEKPESAVLHTRQSDPDQAAAVNDLFETRAAHLPVFLMAGKNVVEAAVSQASKGVSLRELQSELDLPVVIYLGDDVTDETVFTGLTTTDIGIKVGEGQTAARFRVWNVTEVSLLLAYIADMVSKDC